MGHVLFARSLELALHFAVLGGLADVALQLHDGRVNEAIAHAAVASACIIALAATSHIAKRFLGKD